MDDTNDLDFVDSAGIRIGVGLVEDKVRAMNQHSSAGCDFGTTNTEAGILSKAEDLLLYCGVKAFGGCFVVEADRGVAFDEIRAGLRLPAENGGS